MFFSLHGHESASGSFQTHARVYHLYRYIKLLAVWYFENRSCSLSDLWPACRHWAVIQRTLDWDACGHLRCAVHVKLRWPGSANSFLVTFQGTDSLHTTQPHHSRKQKGTEGRKLSRWELICILSKGVSEYEKSMESLKLVYQLPPPPLPPPTRWPLLQNLD